MEELSMTIKWFQLVGGSDYGPSGDSDLTAGPRPLRRVQLNVAVRRPACWRQRDAFGLCLCSDRVLTAAAELQ
jgi:hypothetical protein